MKYFAGYDRQIPSYIYGFPDGLHRHALFIWQETSS